MTMHRYTNLIWSLKYVLSKRNKCNTKDIPILSFACPFSSNVLVATDTSIITANVILYQFSWGRYRH